MSASVSLLSFPSHPRLSPTKQTSRGTASHNAASECWHSAVLSNPCTTWKQQEPTTFCVLSGETRQDTGNEEITRKQDDLCTLYLPSCTLQLCSESSQRQVQRADSFLCLLLQKSTRGACFVLELQKISQNNLFGAVRL